MYPTLIPEFGLSVIKVLTLSAFAFVGAILWTPLLTHYLYKYKMWRKEVRQKAVDGYGTPIFAKLHAEKEVGTPRMGGLLIWITVLGTALIVYGSTLLFPHDPLLQKLNFLSRNQTWLPLATLLAASLVGLLDDLLQIYKKGGYAAGGLRFSRRLLTVALIGFVGALWFYFRLDQTTIHVPFVGDFEIGFLYIPLFVIAMLGVFSGGVVDGLDGLSGGVFAIIFGAFGIIAFFNNQMDLAAMAGVIMGALLAFLWFNIPPARFYMGESGILGLTTVVTVFAFMTDSVFVLPLITLILVLESASVIIQLVSKRLRKGKKVFLVAPLHHHFEALGWPAYKVTMRFWIISAVAAMLGVIIRLSG